MKVELLPAFDDNYLFSLEENDAMMIVDPGSAREVLEHMRAKRLRLELILVTHHHGDHIGGVAELQRQSGAKLFGPSSLAKYGLKADRVLNDGDRFQFHSLEFETMAVPGHTLDHLAYFAAEQLFCGDTLFSLGCGRLFEGSFEQMFASLARLKALPDTTQVYCAHEYTLANMRFSLQYLNENDPQQVPAYEKVNHELRARRERNQPTVPSTIGFEKRYNLFLKAATLEDFVRVRQARNRF
jgi:hydroxyacylglutathione hydrolase